MAHRVQQSETVKASKVTEAGEHNDETTQQRHNCIKLVGNFVECLYQLLQCRTRRLHQVHENSLTP